MAAVLMAYGRLGRGIKCNDLKSNFIITMIVIMLLEQCLVFNGLNIATSVYVVGVVYLLKV